MIDPGVDGPVRRKRCRIKGLIKSVIEQIEFYFSEPNLRRDLSFRKLAGANGTRPVPIVQFIRFNKVNELTQDVQVIYLSSPLNPWANWLSLKINFGQIALQERVAYMCCPTVFSHQIIYWLKIIICTNRLHFPGEILELINAQI